MTVRDAGSAEGDRPRRSSVVLVVCLLLGSLVAGVAIHRGMETKANLAGGAETQAVDTESPGKHAMLAVIEVEGQRYTCQEAGITSAHLGDAVLYDPQNPADCRLAGDVGERNWFMIVFGAALGLAIVSVGLRRR